MVAVWNQEPCLDGVLERHLNQVRPEIACEEICPFFVEPARRRGTQTETGAVEVFEGVAKLRGAKMVHLVGYKDPDGCRLPEDRPESFGSGRGMSCYGADERTDTSVNFTD